MKHLSVNILLLLIFITFQVESGVILGKIADTLGVIECKVVTSGNNIFQDGHHHDPCTTSGNVNYPGQENEQFVDGGQFNGYGNPHPGRKRHGHGQSEHGGQFLGYNQNIDPYQERNWLDNGQLNENKGNGLPQGVLSSSPKIDTSIEKSTTTSTQGGRRILSNIKTNCPEGSVADTQGICREEY